MDFGKLQADIVKNLYKYIDNPAAQDYKIYGDISVDNNKYIPVVYKNWVVYLIPIEKWLIKDDSQRDPKRLLPLLTDIYTASKMFDTGVYKEHCKTQLRQLVTDKSLNIWVNSKLLKPFGNDIAFYNSTFEEDVIYIKDTGDNLLGLVLMVNLAPEAI